mmetsp:Transcript_61134/g.196956  ORF Transcript_61134/g.196956 Transcript_61134/m.196956 type:complete len:202 (-) Transcript_61134:476-1081(-)
MAKPLRRRCSMGRGNSSSPRRASPYARLMIWAHLGKSSGLQMPPRRSELRAGARCSARSSSTWCSARRNTSTARRCSGTRVPKRSSRWKDWRSRRASRCVSSSPFASGSGAAKRASGPKVGLAVRAAGGRPSGSWRPRAHGSSKSPGSWLSPARSARPGAGARARPRWRRSASATSRSSCGRSSRACRRSWLTLARRPTTR